MLGEGERLETPTFNRQVEEEPEKEPEQLLRLAAEKPRRMALKGHLPRRARGGPEGIDPLEGLGPSWRDGIGCRESRGRIRNQELGTEFPPRRESSQYKGLQVELNLTCFQGQKGGQCGPPCREWKPNGWRGRWAACVSTLF